MTTFMQTRDLKLSFHTRGSSYTVRCHEEKRQSDLCILCTRRTGNINEPRHEKTCLLLGMRKQRSTDQRL